MERCSIEGCGWKHHAKDLCRRHYRQQQRGTLGRPDDAPRYREPRRRNGAPVEFPFEVVKMGDDWFRRPTGSHDDWLPVVWPERGDDYAEPRSRGYL